MQLAFPDAICLVDAIQEKEVLIKAYKLKVDGSTPRKKSFLFLMYSKERWDVLLGEKGIQFRLLRSLAMRKFSLEVPRAYLRRFSLWDR
ncbi:hypothetical protein L6164_015563 [Bauhinia variegata]|uniref:Uncharacterized protein n=1 Tax=Bauhinia variegata TaxID=167791 RepID=A0ACB9NLS4_BAUVA|nr:hypothetical protein L6164_015563 [Bauhinia variegata]